MNMTVNNFMQMIQQQAMKDPRIKNALGMIQGKNTRELQTMAMNMCRERNTTPEQVLRQLGFM